MSPFSVFINTFYFYCCNHFRGGRKSFLLTDTFGGGAQLSRCGNQRHSIEMSAVRRVLLSLYICVYGNNGT